MPKFKEFGNGISRLTDRIGGGGAAYDLPDYGEPFEGGYYAGLMSLNGVVYALSVAPASGGITTAQSRTSNSASPGAQTLLDGLGATNAAFAASPATYPAAAWAKGLTIGGFTDWYIPARDELDIAYRNLKPSTTSNVTGNRTKSAIAYTLNDEIDDVTGNQIGRNYHSIPRTVIGYTTSVPGQTTSLAFRTGGAEAFAASVYNSCTEFSSSSVSTILFSNGEFNINTKTTSALHRAFRRTEIARA